MKKESKTLIKKYYNAVKNSIPVSFPNKKNVLKEIESSLLIFSNEHDCFTYDDIVESFGSPLDFANSLIESESTENIRKHFYNNKKITLAIVLILVVIITMAFIIMKDNGSRATEALVTFEEELVTIETAQ